MQDCAIDEAEIRGLNNTWAMLYPQDKSHAASVSNDSQVLLPDSDVQDSAIDEAEIRGLNNAWAVVIPET